MNQSLKQLITWIAVVVVLLNILSILIIGSNAGLRLFGVAMFVFSTIYMFYEPQRSFLQFRLHRRFWLILLCFLLFDSAQQGMYDASGSTKLSVTAFWMPWVVVEEIGRVGLYLLGVANPFLNAFVWAFSHALEMPLGIKLLGHLASMMVFGVLLLRMTVLTQSVWGSVLLHFAINVNPLSIKFNVNSVNT